MKPQLPMDIQEKLPHEVVSLIMSYVPHLTRKEVKKHTTPANTPANPFTMSPSLERNLKLINSKELKGINAMYLIELDDFVLD